MSVQKLESQIDARKEQPAIFMFPVAFLALALLSAGTFEFIPTWIMRDLVDLPHLWHIAELGALAAILLAGTTLGLITRPKQKVLLAQFFVISTVILAVGIVPFDVRGAVLLPIGALFVALYPARRELLRFAPNGSISKPLLILTLAIAVCLDPIIQREITWQINGANDPHAQFLH